MATWQRRDILWTTTQFLLPTPDWRCGCQVMAPLHRHVGDEQRLAIAIGRRCYDAVASPRRRRTAASDGAVAAEERRFDSEAMALLQRRVGGENGRRDDAAAKGEEEEKGREGGRENSKER